MLPLVAGMLATGWISTPEVSARTGLEGLGDPVLDSLIEQGLDRNYDVGMAVRRINIARNNMYSARAGYFPAIGISAGWSRDRISGATVSGSHPTVESSFTAGANISWEPDLFGKITAGVKQKKAEMRVSAADFAATRVSVASEIASAYVNLRVAQAQKELARRHSERQLKVVHITEARHETGLASMLDVSQAQTVYYTTTSSIPLLETSIRTAENSLGVLLASDNTVVGDARKPLYVQPLEYSDSLPLGLLSYRALIPGELPLELIDRRPDVVAAKANIDAAAAALGIARKEYLPSLTITGSVGTQAHRAGDLFTGDSFTYSVAPMLSWTLFDGLARRYNAAAAKEQMQIEVDNYNLTLITAVEEVDNAIIRYRNILKNIEGLEQVVYWSSREESLSLDLYKQGLTAFSNVVDAQLNLLESQNSLISAQGDALLALVDLYKALGGGWQE